MKATAQIFLSYAREDKQRVEAIYQQLAAAGFKPWMDTKDILPGERWQHRIQNAIQQSHLFLACLSTQSVNKRGFVQKELKTALDILQGMLDTDIYLVPVRLEECQVPETLRAFQWVDLFGESEEGNWTRLVRAIEREMEHRGGTVTTEAEIRAPKRTHSLDTLREEPQDALRKEMRNSLDVEFVLISEGEFLMGSADGENDERPVHKVRISQPFYLGKYEVTQAQWEAVMGNNPSHFKGSFFKKGDPNRPVENVSWEEVQEFIRKLNAKEGGAHYRLPTEAEWEYTCRAGSTTAYCFGDDEELLGEYAWYGENAGIQTHPVGQLKPNAWGLYDMHGNVWEWVQDCYGEYPAEAVTDPQGPSSGSSRVKRGGGWSSTAPGAAGRRIAATVPPATATLTSASAC